MKPTSGTHASDDLPWIIVLAAGRTFIGRVAADDKSGALEPVYELHRGVQIGPSPNTPGAIAAGVRTQVLPVAGLVSLKSLVLKVDTITAIVRLADLDKDDRNDIMRHVNACEEMLRHMRAEQAGIRPALVIPGRG